MQQVAPSFHLLCFLFSKKKSNSSRKVSRKRWANVTQMGKLIGLFYSVQICRKKAKVEKPPSSIILEEFSRDAAPSCHASWTIEIKNLIKQKHHQCFIHVPQKFPYFLFTVWLLKVLRYWSGAGFSFKVLVLYGPFFPSNSAHLDINSLKIILCLYFKLAVITFSSLKWQICKWRTSILTVNICFYES